MEEDRGPRVWVDDSNAVFRRGMVACLRSGGFVVAGESCGFVPEPDVSRLDLLVFESDSLGLQRAARLARNSSARLVGVADAAHEEVLYQALEAGLSGFLPREELTPETLVSCLRTVANGNGALPPALLASLMDRLAKGGSRGTNVGQLARRELAVLHLLSDGAHTREIADSLSYSERTVKNIVHDVLVKMNCKTRAQAVGLATRQGLI